MSQSAIIWLFKTGTKEGQPYGTKLNDAMLQNRKSGSSRCQEAECIVVYELMQGDLNQNIDALLNWYWYMYVNENLTESFSFPKQMPWREII